ncbi:PKD domain-containing protein [Hymenobacter sp. BRD128]|uniref:PKD domain-containing protein n=1 Tax=Hymenobacter sp. BRD128 TaxID=2675878 RepID=UPI001565604C|nr:PKD domain-containing protein [Hymenobacter sp. BRD128]QKG55798.1 PKD domain-containing protein [Hymenobacter sp. BRD128]
MKNIWNKAAWALLAGPLALSACSKNDKGSLQGPVPAASFTSTVNSTQYPITVTFTDNSTDGFINQWDFGDGTTGTGQTVTHTYTQAGSYKVRLTESGRGGTNATPQTTVVIPSLCGNAGFSALANCQSNVAGARVFTYSNDAGAVKHLDASNNVTYSSPANSLTSCQADDQFTFSGTSASYTYESNGGTYAGGTCGASQSSSGAFVYKPGGGVNGLGQIILQKAGTFIGEPVAVTNLTYDIIEASSTVLRLRGTLADGTKTEVTLVPFDAVTRVKQLLTNGTQKTWLLDNTSAAPIIVGTEDKPGQYYAGNTAGGQLPACQADDEFTFSAANVYTYDAKAETFVAGVNGAAGSCQAPRSDSTPFTFGPADGAGLAQFVLGKAGMFIGVTDAPDLTYRILAITDKTMLLRAGTGKNGAVVFTIKLVAK